MNAVVHTLHPEQAAKTAPDAPAGKILMALEQMAAGVMTEQLRVMFEGADNLLFEMADKAGKGAQQQAFIDAMRIVRVQRPRMVKAFQDALHAALQRRDGEAASPDVDLDDLDSWSLQDASDLEEKLAVSNMVSKVNSLYAAQLTELEQRMNGLSAMAQGEVSSQALSAGRILEAFQHSMKQLELDLPIKLVIYKLFDLTVVSRLGSVFAGANEMLDANGLKPAAAPARTPKKAPQKRSLDALMQASQPPPAPGLPSMPHLAAALQSYVAPGGAGMAPNAPAGSAPPAGPASFDPVANSQLATEMLAVMQAVGEGRPVDSWMPAQNLSLVGRMFEDMYTDTRLNDAARPMLGKLQFPVMKVALSDPSFFSNPVHPVRSLVNDVFSSLTSDGAVTGADLRRLEELIHELLKRFDPDPAKLRQAGPELVAITEENAEKFLEQQQVRLEEQRKRLREKVRRIVIQELRLHVADRRVPKPAMKLLLSGLAPALGSHYMKGGPTGPGWQRGLELLDRVLASLEPPAAPAEVLDVLMADVRSELAAIGMTPARIDALCERLGEAHADMATDADAAGATVSLVPAKAAPAAEPVVAAAETAPTAEGAVAPEAPAEPVAAAPAIAASPVAQAATPDRGGAPALHMLLGIGEWFRVWEAATKTCRWLKLLNYYPAHDRVVFEDFTGENCLKMKAGVFGHDLAAGRSVAVNPSPATPDLIAQLPPAPAEPEDPQASWFAARQERHAA